MSNKNELAIRTSPITARTEVCVQNATQLNIRDKQQIIAGLAHGSYEMVTLFVFTKAMQSLKKNLKSLGMLFLGELLEKTDISDDDNVNEVITDYEAISLAKELGMVDDTDALYLKQSHELVVHFSQHTDEENNDNLREMSEVDAERIIASCIPTMLTKGNIEPARKFSDFRKSIQSRLLSKDSFEVQDLLASPYFYQRLAVSFLLSDIKSLSGAQLEHCLANLNTLLPVLWDNLKHKEKWQVGRTYHFVYGEGMQKQASGVKKALLKVKGFDFVPETLRSRTFTNAAQKVIDAHDGMNNFYNEPAPMKNLAELGTTLPAPALGKCVTAILCVYLGNTFGTSWDAQTYAFRMLKDLSNDRLTTYFTEYLPQDMKILNKLTNDSILQRWFDLFTLSNFKEASSENHNVQKILECSIAKNSRSIKNYVAKLNEEYFVKINR